LASKDCIKVFDDGGISLVSRRVSPQPLHTDDAERCRAAAAVLGRNFAQINDRVTVYTSLSIRIGIAGCKPFEITLFKVSRCIKSGRTLDQLVS